MSDKEIEVEATPVNQAVALRPEQTIAPVGLFGTTDPSQVIIKAAEVATALKQVVIKQGLVSNIKGKEYPKCEAWTLLGTMLGVFPVLVWTRKLEDGWEARVEARTRDGSIVGAAEAQCLSKEKNWADRDDFALRSMAQTRATAKCLRMPLGFVMTLSGFEATPAEEMVADHPHKPVGGEHSESPKGHGGATSQSTTTPHSTSADTGERLVKKTQLFRTRLLDKIADQRIATEFCRKLGWLMPNEEITALPLRFVPDTKETFEAFMNCLQNFVDGGDLVKPYEQLADENEVVNAASKPIEVPRDKTGNPPGMNKNEEWYDIIVPIPHKGEKRDEYMKHPDTIGSLYEARHDDEEARKRLWGFLNNYEPKGWTKRDGTEMPPSKSDIQFRKALDQFGDWFEKNHPDEKL